MPTTTTGDPDVAWIIVKTSERIARSYAYGYTHHVITDSQGYGEVSLLMVLGRPGEGDAHKVAGIQVARFASGLYAARVADSYAEAIRLFGEVTIGEENC